MQTEAGTLALSADGRVGQPDLGDELEPPELGQHPGIDPVRLAGQRGEPLHLDRVGDPHIPTSQLELVVHEAGATHRLDHRHNRLVRSAQAQHQRSERVRGNGAGLEALPTRQESVEVDAFATQIQSDVQHATGLLGLGFCDEQSLLAEEALLHRIRQGR